MKHAPFFAKESDLCAAFIAAAPPAWTAYAETAGWDILLVRKLDGCQIGIQAKLRLNAAVLVQAAEGNRQWEEGPDYRAVLVPDGETGGLAALSGYCAITVICMRDPYLKYSPKFAPSLPVPDALSCQDGDWHEMMPGSRHELPEYVPDVVAGASAPVQLTNWKIRALRLAILLSDTGYLTREDFRAVNVDIRRWIDGSRWLVPDPQARGFIAGPRLPDFKAQHPRVWGEIKAEPKKWQRRQVPL
jgi:hypothetical protein